MTCRTVLNTQHVDDTDCRQIYILYQCRVLRFELNMRFFFFRLPRYYNNNNKSRLRELRPLLYTLGHAWDVARLLHADMMYDRQGFRILLYVTNLPSFHPTPVTPMLR